jgi:hypothetical protein
MGVLFAVSWAVLSYYQKHAPKYLNNVGNIVKFLNGEEGKPQLLERKLSSTSFDSDDSSSGNRPSYTTVNLEIAGDINDILFLEEMTCPHQLHGTRCEVHWIANFSQSFLFGYGLKVPLYDMCLWIHLQTTTRKRFCVFRRDRGNFEE